MHEFPDLLPWEEMTAMVKRHEKQLEMLATLVHEHAETRELVYCLEKQIDALEKVVADLTAALPQPEKVIESVQSEPMSYTWIDESGVRHIQCVPSDLFAQALERLTPEQKRMLAQAQEDDCIF